MKKTTSLFNSRILIEFLSIAFAVFLALLVNQWKENRHNKKLAEVSLENIRLEINNNKNTIEEMLPMHEKIIVKLDSLQVLVENNIVIDSNDLNINFQLISNTAWDAAQLTQAIAYIDVETVMDISMLYKLQDYFQNFVKEYISKSIYDTDFSITNDLKEIKAAKKFFQLIIRIENNLLEFYKYTQDELLIENNPE